MTNRETDVGAEGGSRTRTSFRTTDFKSAASAIPPPRHVVRNPNSSKPFLISLRYRNRDVYVDKPKMSHQSIQLMGQYVSQQLQR